MYWVAAQRMGQAPGARIAVSVQHAGSCFCFNTEAWKSPVVVSVSEEPESPAFHSFRATRNSARPLY